VSGATVFRDLIKNEGPSALFKGLTPKIGKLESALRYSGCGADSEDLLHSAMTAPKLT
jgi:hypothetical protein